MNERMDRVRERINQKFDEKEAQIGKRLNYKQEQIVTTAIQLLDAEGLNNISLRKLAKLLDLQAPALYWHFKNKEVLIDYMAEAILQEEFADMSERPADEPWQEWLIAMCKRLRKAMLAHRDGARIVAGAHLYPAVTLMKFIEVSQESLVSAGLDERQADLIVGAAVHFTFGRVIEEQSAPTMEHLQAMDMNAFFREYPRIAHSVERMLHDAATGYDEFDATLRLIVGNA
jgi:TetR/AcrR family tetracycline transcriptional repressor